MESVKQAIVFLIKAVGVGVASIFVGGALVWIVSSWQDAQVKVQAAHADASEASVAPYVIASAGIVSKTTVPAEQGFTETTEGIWIVNRKTGAAHLCTASVDGGGTTGLVNCSNDNYGER